MVRGKACITALPPAIINMRRTHPLVDAQQPLQPGGKEGAEERPAGGGKGKVRVCVWGGEGLIKRATLRVVRRPAVLSIVVALLAQVALPTLLAQVALLAARLADLRLVVGDGAACRGACRVVDRRGRGVPLRA